MWIVRVGIALARPIGPQWDWRFLVIPTISALGLTAAVFNLPREARWTYAKPRLEATSAAIRSGAMPVRSGESLRIGSYSLSYDDRADGNIWFRVVDAGFLNSEYLVHSPVGHAVRPAEERHRNTVEHFDGQWWLVNEVF
ncbi:putative protein OS=Tsukamurella paurometabola (strain ATCC 8368 / DSM / CCUG 35730 /CIP 100753 / JCM 10117 / KCTC 9821 / NBRC 16120 / NCIMB 702349/ NCTC 13040) OX=521096 GN=Tpau_0152 PE=4 SV=1 [Tsukamurella paurometabola]|uniref:Uncharacterized protein n=1 Tax=Tsukamurella paurometabola (strain ATCC 8368 / DSM 20162 / CCUG 35730 / CIP 100753 / JCM 10117 / KCTC 9821 / NBRC 16120 / NCIMB 702349 / NCTC 13040) TaxID=521096 RepID=D5UQ38_TSUPD|nr:hypothetical protein [Tsukamurella paurometabola]ADG76806.1 hypothetical protein Tpau_0152 [Tsukamurella paurometabola DSM 20162]SUP41714.1 Uncharacterised protein [Tsukamurella paurometabola]